MFQGCPFLKTRKTLADNDVLIRESSFLQNLQKLATVIATKIPKLNYLTKCFTIIYLLVSQNIDQIYNVMIVCLRESTKTALCSPKKQPTDRKAVIEYLTLRRNNENYKKRLI